LYTLIHEKAPNAYLFHHTDGNVFQIIPDLIETGVDILNPLQTSTQGMNAEVLKGNFGDILIFHGAIEKMEHPIYELIDEAYQKLEVLGKNGGYVFASCNHMIDVPPENIINMFEVARNFQW